MPNGAKQVVNTIGLFIAVPVIIIGFLFAAARAGFTVGVEIWRDSCG